MPRMFISYSRVDRQTAEQLARRLTRIYGAENVWFDEELHGGQVWWETILNQLEHCDIFVYLLTRDSIESTYCRAEYEEAMRLRKQVLPVVIRARTQLPEDLQRLHYVDMSAGLNVDSMTDLQAAITRLGALVPSKPLPPSSPRPIPEPEITLAQRTKLRQPSNNFRVSRWGGVGLGVLVAVIVLVIVLLSTNRGTLPTTNPTIDAALAIQPTSSMADSQSLETQTAQAIAAINAAIADQNATGTHQAQTLIMAAATSTQSANLTLQARTQEAIVAATAAQNTALTQQSRGVTDTAEASASQIAVTQTQVSAAAQSTSIAKTQQAISGTATYNIRLQSTNSAARLTQQARTSVATASTDGTDTATAVPTSTLTLTPSPSPTPSPTLTATETATSIPTPTATATSTTAPTKTPLPTETPITVSACEVTLAGVPPATDALVYEAPSVASRAISIPNGTTAILLIWPPDTRLDLWRLVRLTTDNRLLWINRQVAVTNNGLGGCDDLRQDYAAAFVDRFAIRFADAGEDFPSILNHYTAALADLSAPWSQQSITNAGRSDTMPTTEVPSVVDSELYVQSIGDFSTLLYPETLEAHNLLLAVAFRQLNLNDKGYVGVRLHEKDNVASYYEIRLTADCLVEVWQAVGIDFVPSIQRRSRPLTTCNSEGQAEQYMEVSYIDDHLTVVINSNIAIVDRVPRPSDDLETKLVVHQAELYLRLFTWLGA